MIDASTAVTSASAALDKGPDVVAARLDELPGCDPLQHFSQGRPTRVMVNQLPQIPRKGHLPTAARARKISTSSVGTSRTCRFGCS